MAWKAAYEVSTGNVEVFTGGSDPGNCSFQASHPTTETGSLGCRLVAPPTFNGSRTKAQCLLASRPGYFVSQQHVQYTAWFSFILEKGATHMTRATCKSHLRNIPSHAVVLSWMLSHWAPNGCTGSVDGASRTSFGQLPKLPYQLPELDRAGGNKFWHMGMAKKGLRARGGGGAFKPPEGLGGGGEALVTGQSKEASLKTLMMTCDLRRKAAQKIFFQKKHPHDAYLQMIVAIILSHMCWGTSGTPHTNVLHRPIGVPVT